jgi:hypothetical protein
MNDARGFQKHLPGRRRALTRRDLVTCTARITAGAALAVLPVHHWMQRVAAQDDVVTLTGAASQVSAGRGTAAALAAAAEAVAERAAARVRAAAALANADSEAGAIAQSPVATAAADPEQGAIAQGALATASASSADDEPTPTYGGGGRDPRSRGRRIRGRGGRDRGRVRVDKLPSTGSGMTTPRTLSSFLAAAAVLAAGGAVALRERGAPTEVVMSSADR